MKWTTEIPDSLPISLIDAWDQLAKENPRSLQNPAISFSGEHTKQSWKQMLRWKVKLADTFVRSGMLESPIVDIGCGDGTFIKRCRNKWKLECYGVDICKTFCDTTRGVFHERNRIPLSDSSVGTVVCFNATQHMLYDDIASYLKEASRVLVPDGWLYITFWIDYFFPVPNGSINLHGICARLYPLNTYQMLLYDNGFRCSHSGIIYASNLTIAAKKVGSK